MSGDRTEELLAELDALLAEGEQPQPGWDATYDAATWTPAAAEDDRPVDADAYGNPLGEAALEDWLALRDRVLGRSVWATLPEWRVPRGGIRYPQVHHYVDRAGELHTLRTLPEDLQPRRPLPVVLHHTATAGEDSHDRWPPLVIIDDPVLPHRWLRRAQQPAEPHPPWYAELLQPRPAEPRVPQVPQRPVPLPREYHGTLTVPEDLVGLVRRPDAPYASYVEGGLVSRPVLQEYLARALGVSVGPVHPTWAEQVAVEWGRLVEGWRGVFQDVARQVGASLVTLHRNLQEAGVLPEETPVEPRARALHHAQHRGTGPARPSGQNAHAPRHHGGRR